MIDYVLSEFVGIQVLFSNIFQTYHLKNHRTNEKIQKKIK